MDKEEDEKNCCLLFMSLHWRGILTVLIPTVFSFMLFWEPRKAYQTLYLLIIMTLFWICEAIPMHIAALLPLILAPLMGVLHSEEAAEQFFKDTLTLFMTGVIVALAVEYSNLHKRIALGCILIIGSSPYRLFFSVILVAMLISMWLNNSATTAMMCPIVKAILSELESAKLLETTMRLPDQPDDEPPFPTRIATVFYLGVAYASSIGGVGTPIGTGPNLVWKGLYDGRFPQNKESDFLLFCMMNIPPMLLIALSTYVVLSIQFLGFCRPNSRESKSLVKANEGKDVVTSLIKTKYKELGGMSSHEAQVTVLFLVMVVLLFTRQPGLFPGYADWLPEQKIGGSCCLSLVMILLFAMPTGYGFCRFFCCKSQPPEGTFGRLLSWKFTVTNFPWGLLFLLGGGFCFSAASQQSGLSQLIGDALGRWLKDMPGPIIQLCCIILAHFLTAFSPNVGAANVLLPVFNELAVAVKLHPVYLTLPTVVSVSMAFHLPISTPPNAIISAFANIRTKDMAIGGIGPTFFSIFWLFVFFQTWAYIVFPQMKEFPSWATPLNQTTN